MYNFLFQQILLGLLLVVLGCSRPIADTIKPVTDPHHSLPKNIKVIFDNELVIEFVRIPPGMFRMGYDLYSFETFPLHETSQDAFSSPSFIATITKGYYIGKDNINVKQFVKFLSEQKKNMQEEYSNFDTNNQVRQFENDEIVKILCNDYEPVKTASYPGAVAFCEWAKNLYGLEVRLPTETEWEYAARGHDNAYDSTWIKIGYPLPSPISPNGICGLATGYLGNWVQDHFDLYTKTSKIDPKGPLSTPVKYRDRGRETHVLRRPVFSITNRIGGYYAEKNNEIYGFRIVLEETFVKEYIDNPTKFSVVIQNL